MSHYNPMTLTACVHYDIEVMRSMDNRIIQLHFHPQSTLEISSKLVHTYQKSDTQRKTNISKRNTNPRKITLKTI